MISTFLVLGVLAPMALMSRPVGTAFAYPTSLALAICWYSSLRLGTIVAKGQRRFMAFVFHTFVYIWFGLAAFLQLDADRFLFVETFLGRTFSEETRARGLVIVWVGIVAYELSYATAVRRDASVRSSSSRRVSLVRIRALGPFALVLVVVGIALAGGLGALFTSRAQVSHALGVGSGRSAAGLLGAVVRLPVFIVGFLGILVARQPGGIPWKRLRFGTKALIVASVLSSMLMNNVVSTARFLVGTTLLGFALAWIRPHQRAVLRVAMLAFPLSILVVFPNADLFRRDQVGKIQTGGIAYTLVETADFGMYAQVQTGVEYVERFGYTSGRNLLGPMFFFVPRSIWSGKPDDTGDTIHDALGYPVRLNQSSPLWIELYIAGGYVAVAIGMLGLGWASGRLDWRSTAADTLTLASAVVPVLSVYQVFVLRGSLLGATPRLTALLLLLGFCCREPRRAPEVHDTMRPLAALPSRSS